MTHELERRTVTEGIEVRADDGMIRAGGYASVFDKFSEKLGFGYVETVEKRAFTKTLQESDVLGLFNHDLSRLLGRVKNGTLRLATDERGLSYEVDLPDTPTGVEVAKLLERGDISGSSFGFRAIEEDWTRTESGYPHRRILVAALRDVGPVTLPAYSDASVGLRSLAEARSLDLNEVVHAAERDELRQLLDTVESPDEGDEEEDDRTESIVRPHARRLSALR